MHKRLITILSIFLLSTLTIAQKTSDLTVEWGNFNPQITYFENSKFIGFLDNNVVLLVNSGNPTDLKSKIKEQTIQFFDTLTLKKTSEIKLNIKYNGISLFIDECFIRNQKLWFLSSCFDKKNGKRYFLAHELIDGKAENVKILVETDYLDNRSDGNILFNSEYNQYPTYKFSSDKSKILLLYKDEISKASLMPTLTHLTLFDDLFNPIFENTSAYTEMDLHSSSINLFTALNDGRLIRPEIVSEGVSKKVRLFVYDKSDSTQHTFNLGLDGITNSLSIEEHENGDILVKCEYIQQYDYQNTQVLPKLIPIGVYVLTLDHQLNEKQNTSVLFDQSFNEAISSSLEQSQKSTNSASPISFGFYPIIKLENGNKLLLMEMFSYQITTTVNSYANYPVDGGTARSFGGNPPQSFSNQNIKYFTSDIIGICLNNNGSVKWKKIFPKVNESTANEMYSILSYPIKNENNVHLIMNMRNAYLAEAFPEVSLNNKKGFSIVDYQIDENGEFKVAILDNESDENDVHIIPSLCSPINEKEYFLVKHNFDKRKFAVGRLKIAH